MQTRRPAPVRELLSSMGPVAIIVSAALIVILGVLILIFPPLIQWVVGIGLILAGVGIFAAVVVPER